MIKWIKNNKILTVVFLTVLILITYQLFPATFHSIFWRMERYWELRHNYQEYKALTMPPRNMYIFGKNGYITKIFYHNLNYIQDEDFALINSLPHLRVLRIKTYQYEDDEELICAQMALLDKIDNKNLTELQYDFEKESRIDCLHVPRSVTTLLVRGVSVSNDDLMKLAKFDHVKEILMYGIGSKGRNITTKGVEAFHAVRPDVKVWWDGNINMERKSSDLSFFDFSEY